MTEAEWLSGEQPEPVIDWILANASARKLRLLGCACLRRRWSKLPEASRGAVLIAERFADGGAAEAKLAAAESAATYAAEATSDPALGEPVWDAVAVAAKDAGSFAYGLLLEAECYDFDGFPQHRVAWGLRHQCMLELLGNPFLPTTLDPICVTAAITVLTKSIYDERAFDRMPELADLLERAGCTNANILDHCRGPGPHVRGCWVVDLVLGKS